MSGKSLPMQTCDAAWFWEILSISLSFYPTILPEDYRLGLSGVQSDRFSIDHGWLSSWRQKCHDDELVRTLVTAVGTGHKRGHINKWWSFLLEWKITVTVFCVINPQQIPQIGQNYFYLAHFSFQKWPTSPKYTRPTLVLHKYKFYLQWIEMKVFTSDQIPGRRFNRKFGGWRNVMCWTNTINGWIRTTELTRDMEAGNGRGHAGFSENNSHSISEPQLQQLQWS